MTDGGDSTKKMPPGQLLPIDPHRPVVTGTAHSTKRMALDSVLPLPGQELAKLDRERSASGELLWDLSGSGERSSSGERRLKVPKRVGDIEIRKELARGGMGVVYEGYHPALARSVAVKLLRGGQGASEEDVARFRLEAKAVARLNHPNIVGVHQVGEEKGTHYIVMDLVDGDTLHWQVERFGAFEPATAGRIVRDLALALAHAHANGVLHRDVKPANVLLTKDGRPLLTDFGLAKVEDSKLVLTLTGEVVGTPAFMSPEQARGLDIDERTDVYALGCVLYQALTGQVPFPGESPVDVMNAVVNDKPARPSAVNPKVTPEIDAICWRCLDKDPSRRFKGASELAEALTGFLSQGDEPQAKAAGQLPRWLAPAAGLAVLAAITVLLIPRGGPAPTETPPPTAAAASEDVQRAEALMVEARRSLDRGELKAAATLAEEGLLLDSSPARTTDAALIMHRGGYPDRAIVLLEQLTQTTPPAYEALARIRQIQLEHGPGRIGVLGIALSDLLVRAEERGDDNALTRFAQGERHRLEGRPDDAEQLLRLALELDGDLALAHLSLAHVQASRGARKLSVVSCDKAIDLSPQLTPAHILRIAMLRELGDQPTAREAADQLVELCGRSPYAWLARSDFRLSLGNLLGARKDASRAIELAPELPDGFAARATILGLTQDYEQALADLDRAVELADPPRSDDLARRAWVKFALGDPEGAQAGVDRALELDPQAPVALEVRSKLRASAGNLPGALEDLTAAIEVAPTLDLYLLRIQLFLTLGERQDEARQDLRQARQLVTGPDDPRLQKLKALGQRLRASRTD